MSRQLIRGGRPREHREARDQGGVLRRRDAEAMADPHDRAVARVDLEGAAGETIGQ
jgi:hypothetical protein